MRLRLDFMESAAFVATWTTNNQSSTERSWRCSRSRAWIAQQNHSTSCWNHTDVVRAIGMQFLKAARVID
jgi:hypothetical protein